MTPIAIIAIAAGIIAAYAGATGQNPIEEVRKALTDGPDGPDEGSTPLIDPADEPQGLVGSLSLIGGGSGAVVAGGVDTSPGRPNDTRPLAPLPGNPGHQLQPGASAAFAQWSQKFGAPILVTDSYRSYELQARRKAEEPNRFASADKSWHCRALAVDVHLPKTTGGQSRAGQPVYDRLRAAAQATGWVTYSDGNPDKGDVWHFSYGGRG